MSSINGQALLPYNSHCCNLNHSHCTSFISRSNFNNHNRWVNIIGPQDRTDFSSLRYYINYAHSFTVPLVDVFYCLFISFSSSLDKVERKYLKEFEVYKRA